MMTTAITSNLSTKFLTFHPHIHLHLYSDSYSIYDTILLFSLVFKSHILCTCSRVISVSFEFLLNKNKFTIDSKS